MTNKTYTLKELQTLTSFAEEDFQYKDALLLDLEALHISYQRSKNSDFVCEAIFKIIGKNLYKSIQQDLRPYDETCTYLNFGRTFGHTIGLQKFLQKYGNDRVGFISKILGSRKFENLETFETSINLLTKDFNKNLRYIIVDEPCCFIEHARYDNILKLAEQNNIPILFLGQLVK